MKRNAEKLCCFWFINFCYCYSCCLSLFLFCFACLISLIFFYFVLVLFSTIFLIWTYCFPREKLQTYSEASIFFPPYIGQSVRTTAEPGRFSRSLTFPDDLKGLNRVPRLQEENHHVLWVLIRRMKPSLKINWFWKIFDVKEMKNGRYTRLKVIGNAKTLIRHQLLTSCQLT